MKYGPALGAQEWSALRRRIRLTTTRPEFLEFLPPGLIDGEIVTQFGPVDIAPMGQPDQALSQTDVVPMTRPGSDAEDPE